MRKPFTTSRRRSFDPASAKPFKVSRSGIELFVECSRCFYLHHRLGVRRPSGPPFAINSLIDRLLKKEFDVHRAKRTAHPLMAKYGIDAVPFEHPEINRWRQNFKGMQALHAPSQLLVTGAVDDLWIGPDGKVMVVDYKATAKQGEVSIDADWQKSYKRQIEIYQWLARRQHLDVSDTGYFVYCNGRDAEAFDGRVEFSIKLFAYAGSDGWVEPTLREIRACLEREKLPPFGKNCEYCGYASKRAKVDRQNPKAHDLPA